MIKEVLPEWVRLRGRSAEKKYDKQVISEARRFKKGLWIWHDDEGAIITLGNLEVQDKK